MPMQMVHRPRSARRMQQDVAHEVSTAYSVACSYIKRELERDVIDWARKPKFYCYVSVTKRKWMLWFGYDARTTGGQNYKRADEGTGERSGKPGHTAYKIRPKNKKALAYDVPNFPKTQPVDGGRPRTNIIYGEIRQDKVIRQEVIHPGIWPRNFTKALRDELSERTKVGGFKSITEAAVKRAFRKRFIASLKS